MDLFKFLIYGIEFLFKQQQKKCLTHEISDFPLYKISIINEKTKWFLFLKGSKFAKTKEKKKQFLAFFKKLNTIVKDCTCTKYDPHVACEKFSKGAYIQLLSSNKN